jgi:hypothetical protein
MYDEPRIVQVVSCRHGYDYRVRPAQSAGAWDVQPLERLPVHETRPKGDNGAVFRTTSPELRV